MKPVIRIAQLGDVPIIQYIAARTWPNTFGNILSPMQIQYMLNLMYSSSEITKRIIHSNHKFFLVEINGKSTGYLEIELNHPSIEFTKIHKIYILPEMHGQGLGKLLMTTAEKEAKKNQCTHLILNVNKHNPATYFYEKMGYVKIKEDVIDIGQGYVMDDYVYQKII